MCRYWFKSYNIKNGWGQIQVDWVWNNGILEAQEIEKIETEIKRASTLALPSVEIKAFKNFLSKL